MSFQLGSMNITESNLGHGTLAFWMKAPFPNNSRLFWNTIPDPGNARSVYFISDPGRLGIYFGYQQFGQVLAYQWNHVIFGYDGSSAYFWINGLYRTVSVENQEFDTTGTQLGNHFTTYLPFLISDVRWFDDTILTEAQGYDLYLGLNSTPAPLPTTGWSCISNGTPWVGSGDITGDFEISSDEPPLSGFDPAGGAFAGGAAYFSGGFTVTDLPISEKGVKAGGIVRPSKTQTNEFTGGTKAGGVVDEYPPPPAWSHGDLCLPSGSSVGIALDQNTICTISFWIKISPGGSVSLTGATTATMTPFSPISWTGGAHGNMELNDGWNQVILQAEGSSTDTIINGNYELIANTGGLALNTTLTLSAVGGDAYVADICAYRLNDISANDLPRWFSPFDRLWPRKKKANFGWHLETDASPWLGASPLTLSGGAAMDLEVAGPPVERSSWHAGSRAGGKAHVPHEISMSGGLKAGGGWPQHPTGTVEITGDSYVSFTSGGTSISFWVNIPGYGSPHFYLGPISLDTGHRWKIQNVTQADKDDYGGGWAGATVGSVAFVYGDSEPGVVIYSTAATIKTGWNHIVLATHSNEYVDTWINGTYERLSTPVIFWTGFPANISGTCFIGELASWDTHQLTDSEVAKLVSPLEEFYPGGTPPNQAWHLTVADSTLNWITHDPVMPAHTYAPEQKCLILSTVDECHFSSAPVVSFWAWKGSYQYSFAMAAQSIIMLNDGRMFGDAGIPTTGISGFVNGWNHFVLVDHTRATGGEGSYLDVWCNTTRTRITVDGNFQGIPNWFRNPSQNFPGDKEYIADLCTFTFVLSESDVIQLYHRCLTELSPANHGWHLATGTSAWVGGSAVSVTGSIEFYPGQWTEGASFGDTSGLPNGDTGWGTSLTLNPSNGRCEINLWESTPCNFLPAASGIKLSGSPYWHAGNWMYEIAAGGAALDSEAFSRVRYRNWPRGGVMAEGGVVPTGIQNLEVGGGLKLGGYARIPNERIWEYAEGGATAGGNPRINMRFPLAMRGGVKVSSIVFSPYQGCVSLVSQPGGPDYMGGTMTLPSTGVAGKEVCGKCISFWAKTNGTPYLFRLANDETYIEIWNNTFRIQTEYEDITQSITTTNGWNHIVIVDHLHDPADASPYLSIWVNDNRQVTLEWQGTTGYYGCYSGDGRCYDCGCDGADHSCTLPDCSGDVCSQDFYIAGRAAGEGFSGIPATFTPGCQIAEVVVWDKAVDLINGSPVPLTSPLEEYWPEGPPLHGWHLLTDTSPWIGAGSVTLVNGTGSAKLVIGEGPDILYFPRVAGAKAGGEAEIGGTFTYYEEGHGGMRLGGAIYLQPKPPYISSTTIINPDFKGWMGKPPLVCDCGDPKHPCRKKTTMILMGRNGCRKRCSTGGQAYVPAITVCVQNLDNI